MAKATAVSPFKDGAPFVLNGVKVLWAHVQRDNPDTKYERCWTVTAVLDKDEAASLEAAGFTVKENTETGEFTMVIKTKCTTKDGKDNKPPQVVGRDGRTAFTEEIGNGSICNIKAYGKEWEVSGKSGVGAYLNAIQVSEHVERGAGFGDLDEGNNAFLDSE